jgi:hypothetical protein
MNSGRGRLRIVIWGLAALLVLAGSFWATSAVMDMYSPLLGQRVSYSLNVSNKPEVCVAASSNIVFEGTICRVSGSRVWVLWDELTNPSVTSAGCGLGKSVTWKRSDHAGDIDWMRRYLGFCGRGPVYFEKMRYSIEYSALQRPLPAH